VPLRRGEAFDRYVIEDVLGQGGMGVVYRARDPKLHRSVALKVLAPRREGASSESEAEGAARLLREARAAAALDHPNAVAIFDVGEVEGAPFIAMELVEGSSLRAHVGDASATLAQRVGWLVDVAKALHAAHERGLVHRDVKPENVMVRRDGVAKVLDFGIARRARAESTAAADAAALPTITGEGIVVGTPLYMAPEQLRGEKLDGRADQFAWGSMGYELLAGKLPWRDAGDGMAIVAAITSKDPPPLDQVAPSVPPAVARVVERALAKDPSDRFESMRAASDALVAAAGISRADPAFAPTETAPPAAARARRAPLGRWMVPVGLALVAAAGALAWSFRQPSTAPPVASAAPGAWAAARPIACNDAPIPESKVPEAVTAYRAAIQAYCDASLSLARNAFQRAVDHDPSMAAAHVRLAYVLFSYGQVEEARREMQTAQQLRATLAPCDRDLLEFPGADRPAQPTGLGRIDPARRCRDRAFAVRRQLVGVPGVRTRLGQRLRTRAGRRGARLGPRPAVRDALDVDRRSVRPAG
jgi:serine/threonine-protein kinase